MITLQMMKGTGPYNQMQRYIADVHKDLTPQQRAGKFTALLKKYVNNQNAQHPGKNVVPDSLMSSFYWVRSPEGGKFWDYIDLHYHPVKEQPAAPALIWPKDATHYRPDIKRLFNVGGQWDVNGDMKWYKFTGARTYEKWSALPQTIKRPETPLPNGGRWLEGYTHANRHEGTWFQFNDEHYTWDGEVKPWGEFGRKREWFEKRTTIQRYPDNQPLILDVPPQAPVRPVEARNPPEVGQPIQAENVAAKAPVEPPEAMPEVKKPIGWWK